MFSRSSMALARRNLPFPQFYKSVVPMINVAGPRRMHVAAALWRMTTPKHQYAVNNARKEHARKLYEQHGNAVVQVAKKQSKKNNKVKRLATQKHKKTTPKKGKANKRKPTPKKKQKKARTIKKKSAPKKKKSSATSKPAQRKSAPYAAFRDTVMRRCKLSASKSTDDRLFRLWVLTGSQRHLSDAGRVEMAVRLVEKNAPKHKKKIAKRRSAPAKRKTTKKASKASRKKKAASTKKAVKTSKRKTIKKKSLPKKKLQVKHNKTKAARSHRKNPDFKGRNPYLKFYRAMVLTGHVPNHPRGARSRRIKDLWRNTKHLKTLESRIKLGAAYATGAQMLPSDAAKLAAKKKAVKPVVKDKKKTVPVRSAKKAVKRTAKAQTKKKNTLVNYDVLTFDKKANTYTQL